MGSPLWKCSSPIFWLPQGTPVVRERCRALLGIFAWGCVHVLQEWALYIHTVAEEATCYGETLHEGGQRQYPRAQLSETRCGEMLAQSMSPRSGSERGGRSSWTPLGLANNGTQIPACIVFTR